MDASTVSHFDPHAVVATVTLTREQRTRMCSVAVCDATAGVAAAEEDPAILIGLAELLVALGCETKQEAAWVHAATVYGYAESDDGTARPDTYRLAITVRIAHTYREMFRDSLADLAANLTRPDDWDEPTRAHGREIQRAIATIDTALPLTEVSA